MRALRLLWVAVFAVSLCAAQDRPPVCPAANGAASIRPPAPRPTAEQITRAAEAEAADPSVMVAAEPENFGVERYRLEDYADCVRGAGCYWADVDAQARRAEMALEGAVKAKRPGERLALVLDIDETSLSSYCEMRREDFGFIPSMFNQWVMSEAAVVLPGTLRLFRRARELGVAIFFLTGRPEEQRAATERNLRAAGYSGWAGLILRDAAEKRMATIAYKASERLKITKKGYRIVMSVGDQWSDLAGQPKAEISVKLPNPFYYLP